MSSVICVDAIVKYMNGLVCVERLGSVPGLALPGGKQGDGEMLSKTVVREVLEETGLHFVIESVLGTYAHSERDPRGNYVSTIFVGSTSGVPRGEQGKTRAVILSREEIVRMRDLFVFDHFHILEHFFTMQ